MAWFEPRSSDVWNNCLENNAKTNATFESAYYNQNGFSNLLLHN